MVNKLMPKVAVIQVVYNSRRFIEPVFTSVFNQTFKNFKFFAVISGNDDGSKELIAAKFPEVEIIDPGYNIGFAKGHNLIFKQPGFEYFQLVNPDLVLAPDYIEKMLQAFSDPKVGAATGKLYKIPNDKFQTTNSIRDYLSISNRILDTTGVVIAKSGSARDRGQHETDSGQFDHKPAVQAVSAAGAMYKKEALRTVGYPVSSDHTEFFDEDFHSYWEDVDLAWRMTNAGWECRFVPQAIGFHGRTAGSSKNGYKNVLAYVKFHKTLSPQIRRLNYRNHILMYVKNSQWFYPQFFIREFFMLGYILLFEISTLKVLPEIFRLLPKMWKKRKFFTKPI
jgi:GT2 family glycosyltransferase